LLKQFEQLIFRAGLFYCGLQFLMRLYLASSLIEDTDIQVPELAIGIMLGFIRDLVSAILFLAPLYLVSLFRNLQRLFIMSYSHLLIFLVLVFAIVEVFFWMEFDGRPDRLVFHYLKYPVEVLAFLEDQFYLSLLLFPLAFVVWLVGRLLRPWMELLVSSNPDEIRHHWPALIMILFVLVSPWIFNKGYFPHSDMRQVNQLSSNGIFSVLHAASIDITTWKTGETGTAKIPGPEACKTPEDEMPALLPKVKHLVLIIEESFAGDSWWDKQKRKKFMPNLKRLSESGVYFSNVYATGSRTMRGMEAILHGYPPLPGISLTNREGFEKLPSLARELGAAGYYSKFVYGGWPHFSNFTDYWTRSGFDSVVSREDFDDKSFETSWGVADEILFDKIILEMDALTRQHDHVFVSTLTVSNHRPYDFPSDRVPFPANERRPEFAIAYADYALGQFLTNAMQRPWYKDTLFVVIADHGPNVRGRSTIPVKSYHVPLLFLSEHLSAREDKSLGSSMDIPGTILSLLGIVPRQQFWSSDLFANTNGKRDGIALVEYNYSVGMISPNGLTVNRFDGSATAWQADELGQWNKARVDEKQLSRLRSVFGSAHSAFYSEINERAYVSSEQARNTLARPFQPEHRY